MITPQTEVLEATNQIGTFKEAYELEVYFKCLPFHLQENGLLERLVNRRISELKERKSCKITD